MNKTNVSCRVIRWILLLQEFDITIIDKPRKHNAVVYFLSTLTHVADKDLIDDKFLDEHVFAISLHT